jgi:hypothetical protein
VRSHQREERCGFVKALNSAGLEAGKDVVLLIREQILEPFAVRRLRSAIDRREAGCVKRARRDKGAAERASM